MASCWGESVEAVERRKGFWRSRDYILLLISQYREHETLFRNVHYKKKRVWELITTSKAAVNPNFSARPEQVGEKSSGSHWHSAFRNSISEVTEKNTHCTGKLQSSMVADLMFARMRQAAALGRRIENSRHFSEPAFCVAKVAKRQKNQLTFSCNRQQAHQNI